jgi:uncharacterized protein YdcH (DUF465 family)
MSKAAFGRRRALKYASTFLLGVSAGATVGYYTYHPRYELFRDRFFTLYEHAVDMSIIISWRLSLQRCTTEIIYTLVEGGENKLQKLIEEAETYIKLLEDPELTTIWEKVKKKLKLEDEIGIALELLLENQHKMEDMMQNV